MSRAAWCSELVTPHFDHVTILFLAIASSAPTDLLHVWNKLEKTLNSEHALVSSLLFDHVIMWCKHANVIKITATRLMLFLCACASQNTATNEINKWTRILLSSKFEQHAFPIQPRSRHIDSGQRLHTGWLSGCLAPASNKPTRMVGRGS